MNKPRALSTGLGGKKTQSLKNTNINNIAIDGFYYISNCNINGTAFDDGYLLQLTISENYKIQFYTYSSLSKTNFPKYRKKVAGNWQDWQEIGESNCKYINGIDVNTINTTQINYCNLCTNLPQNNSNGYLITLRYNDDYMMQKFFRRADKLEYTRYKENGVWSEWFPTQGQEEVNNENGTYVKFANGFLVCRNNMVSCNANTESVTINFPTSFIEPPTITLSNRYSNSRNILWSQGDITKTNFRAFPLMNNGTLPNVTAVCSYIAVGKWK